MENVFGYYLENGSLLHFSICYGISFVDLMAMVAIKTRDFMVKSLIVAGIRFHIKIIFNLKPFLASLGSRNSILGGK